MKGTKLTSLILVTTLGLSAAQARESNSILASLREGYSRGVNSFGAVLAGVNSCGDISPQAYKRLDQALPCSNGEQTYVNVNSAPFYAQQLAFYELARRNKADADCRQQFYLKSAKDPKVINQLSKEMLEAFVKIRPKIRELRAKAQKIEKSLPAPTVGDAIDKRSAKLAQTVYDGLSLSQIANELQKLVASVPLGFEPEILKFILNADSELPLDFEKLPEAKKAAQIARFKASMPEALIRSSDKYYETAKYLQGTFKKQNTAGGFFDLSEADKRRFGSADVFDSFGKTLNVPENEREALVCRLNAKYRDGAQAIQAGELLVAGLGIGALVGSAVVSGGATAPITAPIIAGLTVLEVASTINLANETINACYSKDFIVSRSANMCNVGQAVDQVVAEAKASKCAVGVGLTIAAAALSVAEVATLGKQLDEIALASEKKLLSEEAQLEDLAKAFDPEEQDDARQLLEQIKYSKVPPLKNKEVIKKLKEMLADGTCPIGARSVK